MDKWIVVVEGEAYGFFKGYELADMWAKKNFPIAYTQGNTRVSKFVKV